MTHQRCLPGESPCYGSDPEWGAHPAGNGWRAWPLRTVLMFIALAAFVAYSGYRTHTTGPGVSSDRWAGLFWLSMCVLVLAALLRIPKIARSRAIVKRD